MVGILEFQWLLLLRIVPPVPRLTSACLVCSLGLQAVDVPLRMSELQVWWNVGACLYGGGIVRWWCKSPNAVCCTAVNLVWVPSYRAVIILKISLENQDIQACFPVSFESQSSYYVYKLRASAVFSCPPLPHLICPFLGHQPATFFSATFSCHSGPEFNLRYEASKNKSIIIWGHNSLLVLAFQLVCINFSRP